MDKLLQFNIGMQIRHKWAIKKDLIMPKWLN